MLQRACVAKEADLCCPDNWIFEIGHDDGSFEDIC